MASNRKSQTQGGAHVEGDVHTGDGDFIGRDKIVHGDEVHGDKIVGDVYVTPSLWQRLARWWRRFHRRPLVFYPTLTAAILVFIIALWNILFSFRPVIGDEILIVVASFHHSEGIPDTEAHNEICRAIRAAARELGFSRLRVEVEPTRLAADDRAGAERLGRRYNASMVIWGADTGVRVTVNFLNLKQPDFGAAEVRISETERTQLANPSVYAGFITQDLPDQLTFLSLFGVGHSHYLEEAYAESIRAIEKAIASLAPGTEPPEGLADAYFRLGWLYQMPMEDDEKAIACYDEVIALDSNYAKAYGNRGVARKDQGDLAGAIADYNRAIARDPGDAITYNNRGNARKDQGDLGGAIADYDQAITLDPGYALAYYNRGNARKAQGDVEGAITDYDQAIAFDPDFAAAYNNRGLARYAQGDLAGAIIDYDQAIALDPGHIKAYNNRGVARKAQGDLEGAIADYDQAIALDPDYAKAYYNRGLARKAQGDLGGAIADCDQAIALDPDFAKAYYNRGGARKAQGDLQGAVEDFDKATALDRDFADAYWGRGLAHRELGKAEAALDDFRRYLELCPNADNREMFEAWIAELEAEISGE